MYYYTGDNMILSKDFFERDRLEVAPELIGKLLVCRSENGIIRQRITETEAYGTAEDTACHAHRGRTPRNEVLFMEGGLVYVYLCYGVHWLLNVITGEAESPQGVLIRACENAEGPGRLTKAAGINGSFNRMYFCEESGIWFEDDGFECDIKTDKRVGIGYASQEDQDRQWRFIMDKK